MNYRIFLYLILCNKSIDQPKLCEQLHGIPTHVFLFQPPIVCQWNSDENVWSTEDVHEFEYDGIEQTVSFKTGKFGSYAIATPRYLNFPFKYWEIKANDDATITFFLETQILNILFTVKENFIYISEINMEQEGYNTELLDTIVGKSYNLPALMRTLRNIGIELFPPYDAFCYIEGSCEKHLQMEKHLYTTMGHLSISYNFVWSRWNFAAGRRKAVMLMREYKPGKIKQLSYGTVMVTPINAVFLNCNEESEAFNETIEDFSSFHTDLYTLYKSTTNVPVAYKIKNSCPSTATTLSELLLATRMLSLC